MDRLWTPWRFEYIRNADKAQSCVFCEIIDDTRDAKTLFCSGARTHSCSSTFSPTLQDTSCVSRAGISHP